MALPHDLPPLQALIFDVDGTLADTEAVHRAAFNQAFIEEGLDWQWDDALYTRLLDVSGGKERLRHFWQSTQGDVQAGEHRDVQEIIERVHARKTASYEAMVNDGMVPLRPGVMELLDAALAQGFQLAIATTTTPANIAALLRATRGARWKSDFRVIEDAMTAPRKKPHADVYLQALYRLQAPAAACVAFEDSGHGLLAARGAGLCTIITPTRFTAQHDFSAALQVLPSLQGVGLDQLREWRIPRALSATFQTA